MSPSPGGRVRLRELDPGPGHERLVECVDADAGYHGFVAVHSTRLGPALGGTRVWPYATPADARDDALRLSRGMSYKAALAGLPFGGGKAAIVADGRALAGAARERLFLAHGRFVETFGGRYVTAEDVGTGPADMATVRRETAHVAGLPDASGDPSPNTAHGVFRATQAAAAFRWGSDALGGRTVAVQGCGAVGARLAGELHRAGARVVVADVDAARAERVAAAVGGRTVAPDAIYDVEADVYAPCALGGVLDDVTIPRLRAAVVVGAANNQLREPRHGAALEARGITYVPDFLANAGGIIYGVRDLTGAATPAEAAAAVDRIYDTALRVLALARSEGVPASVAADRLAEARLRGDAA